MRRICAAIFLAVYWQSSGSKTGVSRASLQFFTAQVDGVLLAR
jgi:hypothetical protein